ncbi:MAG: MBL fold metallo-hydrolase [Nitrososphaerota archaeon]|nr:MBL fold metallo-hydrolase [Nitrososphaerota archaeon]
MLRHKGAEITYLEHDTFRIASGGVNVYTDPFKIAPQPVKADIVAITHEHFDHMNAEDLKKVLKPETIVIASVNCREALGSISAAEKVFVKPGDAVTRKGVSFTATAAYNTNKFREPGKVFHPKEYLGVGFLIDAHGTRVYHAGDTDNIPEMADLGDVSVALLPVSGTYVMTAEEAAEALRSIRSEIAIPMHYGAIVGTPEDAGRFGKLAAGAVVLEKEKA